MALIDEVKVFLSTYSEYGWKELFLHHGLNILAEDLASELEKPLQVNRNIPGFKEFSLEGRQAVTPGQPAHSLLYHAFASPSVQWSDINKKHPLKNFPEISELNLLENYIYAALNKSLIALETVYGIRNLAIVVFANQYRQSIDTVHKKHADMVFSRTGIARVGNDEAHYDKKLRSYVPLNESEPNKIRVLPAKYNAYIAVKQKGDSALLGQRFIASSDAELDFWVPIHKLFDGSECLTGLNITLQYEVKNSNEKISRIHNFITSSMELSSGSSPEKWKEWPFKFSDNIASYSAEKNFLIPVVHESLVEEAITQNAIHILNKNYTVPKMNNRSTIKFFSSSLELRTGDGSRSAPEYVHIRTKVDGNTLTNLNNSRNVMQSVTENFNALHYIDYTGDGFVRVSHISGGASLNNYTSIAAYSIVAAPDFFPFCTQAEMSDIGALSEQLWAHAPDVLADLRIHPNIQSHPELRSLEMTEFDTSTALIGGTRDVQALQSSIEEKINRISFLTDSAAGLFAPGWDTSIDFFQHDQRGIMHLAAYGLGSPFPEDAKLCAALSSFWPAVAPDITRSFWPNIGGGPTIIPLTDDEIGSTGNTSWDGETGPQRFTEDGTNFISYAQFERVDYTINALENKFNYHVLAKIDAAEYKHRLFKFSKVRTLVRNLPLISYTISQNAQQRDDIFTFAQLSPTGRFTTGQRVIMKIESEVTLQIDANNQITQVP